MTCGTIYGCLEDLLSAVRLTVQNYSNFMQMDVRSASEGGYSSELMIVTVAPHAPGGQLVPVPADPYRILLNFGQHGREPITSEVALRLLHMIGEGRRHGGSTEGGGHSGWGAGTQGQGFVVATAHGAGVPVNWDDEAHLVDPLQLLQAAVVKIVPMENVNGRKKVDAGDFCERKNGRGVDTNRNWGLDWGKKERDYDPSEEYPGTAAFSEPEAKMILELVTDFQPHMWINVHSGMEALFTPFDHVAKEPDARVADAMKSLLHAVNRAHCGRRCVVGSGGAAVGYLAHGTATDYIFSILKVPLSYTWEIFGDLKAHTDDCFRMFNPVTAATFEAAVTNWAEAFFTAFSRMPYALQKLNVRVGASDLISWVDRGAQQRQQQQQLQQAHHVEQGQSQLQQQQQQQSSTQQQVASLHPHEEQVATHPGGHQGGSGEGATSAQGSPGRSLGEQAGKTGLSELGFAFKGGLTNLGDGVSRLSREEGGGSGGTSSVTGGSSSSTQRAASVTAGSNQGDSVGGKDASTARPPLFDLSGYSGVSLSTNEASVRPQSVYGQGQGLSQGVHGLAADGHHAMDAARGTHGEDPSTTTATAAATTTTTTTRTTAAMGADSTMDPSRSSWVSLGDSLRGGGAITGGVGGAGEGITGGSGGGGQSGGLLGGVRSSGDASLSAKVSLFALEAAHAPNKSASSRVKQGDASTSMGSSSSTVSSMGVSAGMTMGTSSSTSDRVGSTRAGFGHGLEDKELLLHDPEGVGIAVEEIPGETLMAAIIFLLCALVFVVANFRWWRSRLLGRARWWWSRLQRRLHPVRAQYPV
eukprot:jgi/Mesvir1/24314/Mv11000-RA.1